MTSTKNYTAQELIDNRDKLNQTIARSWKIIQTENVLDKHEAHLRTADLKKTYESIKLGSESRVQAKLASMAANFGFTSITEAQPFINNSIFPTIFELWEVRDMLENWREVKTINPAVKAKYGKQKLRKCEEITATFKAEEMKKLELKSNSLQKKLSDFNSDHKFDATNAFSYSKVL